MIEMNLQLRILYHKYINIFLGSRFEKLIDDVTNFVQSPFSSDQSYNLEQKRLLRKSFRKGIHMCFEESYLDSVKLMVDFDNRMDVLFSLFPECSQLMSSDKRAYEQDEWSMVVKCLGKAWRGLVVTMSASNSLMT
ncbi:hypothetical protein L1887_36735 [Cichorium endivia]|nr:hypothetical protein L1887_36735 [Cichorium endivia]